MVRHLPNAKRPHHQQANFSHQGHGGREQGPQKIDAIVDRQIVLVGFLKTPCLSLLLGKRLDHANSRNGVSQHVGQFRPDPIDFFKTGAQTVTHDVDQPGNEGQRQQSGASQPRVDGEKNDRGHEDHQHIGGEIKQMQRQKDAEPIGLTANARHEVACAPSPKILERQFEQKFVRGGAQICANAFGGQCQDIGFEPTQSPSQSGGGQQTAQIKRDQRHVDLLTVLKRDQHIVHQGHGEVRWHQGGRRRGQGQHKTQQQLTLVGFGKTPKPKQTPGGHNGFF